MKKIISILIAIIMCVSSVSAAAVPGFLYETALNYTMSAEISMDFSGSDSLISLLKEYELYDQISNYIDIEAVLSSFFQTKQEAFYDISEDLNRISFGLKQKSENNITFNRNLSTKLNINQELWVEADIAKEEMKVVFTQLPFNKYVIIDFSQILDDTQKEQVFGILKTVLNKHYINTITKDVANLLVENAQVTQKNTKCTITMNNDEFRGFIKALIQYVIDIAESVTKEEIEDTEIIFGMIDEINFLGSNGYKVDYTLSGGKVSTMKSTADISISLSEKLCEEIGFDKNFKLDFSIGQSSKCTNYGKTKVKIPELTEQNSIDFSEIYPDSNPSKEYEYYEEYKPEYPYFSASGEVSVLPCINGEYYVPLRMTMKDAYGDGIEILYDNGVITLKSEYFDGYKEIKMSIGNDAAYMDGAEIKITPLYTDGETTYISTNAITDLFGWELVNLDYDILLNSYHFTFFTR